jgi:hypothetical protein
MFLAIVFAFVSTKFEIIVLCILKFIINFKFPMDTDNFNGIRIIAIDIQLWKLAIYGRYG